MIRDSFTIDETSEFGDEPDLRSLPPGARYLTPEDCDNPVPLTPPIDVALLPTVEDYFVDFEAGPFEDAGDVTVCHGSLAPRAPWELVP